jgi:hypothetical protein
MGRPAGPSAVDETLDIMVPRAGVAEDGYATLKCVYVRRPVNAAASGDIAVIAVPIRVATGPRNIAALSCFWETLQVSRVLWLRQSDCEPLVCRTFEFCRPRGVDFRFWRAP